MHGSWPTATGVQPCRSSWGSAPSGRTQRGVPGRPSSGPQAPLRPGVDRTDPHRADLPPRAGRTAIRILGPGALAAGQHRSDRAVGKESAKVVIAPYDPRQKPLTLSTTGQPEWVPELYQTIAYEVGQLQTPRNQASAETSGGHERRF